MPTHRVSSAQLAVESYHRFIILRTMTTVMATIPFDCFRWHINAPFLVTFAVPACRNVCIATCFFTASGIWRRLPGISFACDRNSRRGGLWGFTRMQHYQYDSTPSKPYKQGIARADAWPPNKSAHVCEHRKRGIVRAIVWLHSKTKGKRLCVRWSILVYQYGTCCHT